MPTVVDALAPSASAGRWARARPSGKMRIPTCGTNDVKIREPILERREASSSLLQPGTPAKTFEIVEGYDEMIVLRGIRFESHCEHHLAPIIGRAWVAYIPSSRVVGISKLARVVEVYAKRLQIQERLTAQIADTIEETLNPRGVGVIIKATHHCMSTRGVHQPDTDLVTSRMLGCFRDNSLTRQEFLTMVD